MMRLGLMCLLFRHGCKYRIILHDTRSSSLLAQFCSSDLCSAIMRVQSNIFPCSQPLDAGAYWTVGLVLISLKAGGSCHFVGTHRIQQ